MVKTLQESIIQFIGAMILGWVIMYFVPAKLFFTLYLPSSFFFLFWLVLFAVVARGWPIAPPEGIWKPGMSKLIPGFSMTLIWIVVSILSSLIVTKVWPAIPLFPVTIYFGILLFMTTLWYVFVWGGYPFANKSGLINLICGAIIISIITVVLWLLLANFKDTPWAGAPYNPNGLFQVDFMLGLAIWIITWIVFFGNAFSMQTYPFYKLGQPTGQILLTVFAIIMGYFSWVISLKFLSPTFSSGAIAGSIIGWSLFHSVFFGYYPNAKYAQPKRGIYNLIMVAICVAIWIPLLRLILSPILAISVGAGLPFDISNISVFYTLHVLAIILLVHSFFWLKTPFTPPGPPIGPEEIPPEA